ncbi:uncharacterized protein LOC117897951 isoform X1 [Drosophila subobscura]|uniref:uncharacterized protein LOC117897951 isoform X1 n=1 Tax=Drosophila subobscura TaxID=7241 RepID=UPI00155A7688|nr:uncharacterized protein LOC117897951 isoform X1 [Drosophila subobscura]XP_034662943.1 uncharacterized protein LOC117897951 isoform X1 [Drosophila subobscura]
MQLQLRSMTKKRVSMMMKTTTKTTCCLVLVALMLLVDSSVAARKLLPKRPVKPLKTFPRNNATPIPAAGALTAAAAATVGAAATAAAGAATLNGSELPKPLTLQSDEPAEAIVASPPGTPSAAASASASASASESALASASVAAASPANAETKADDLANQTPTATPSGSGLIDEDCEPDMIGFELITGFVLSAPSRQLETLPGTLMLTDCLEACQANESCSSVNYETGLCVMFRSTADQLPGSLSRSQYPVFTVYAQKSCFGVRPCSKAWCIDRVQGYRLPERAKASQSVATRRDCIELCLGETEFTCRSANYYAHSGLCELSDMDRITLSDEANIAAYDGADYLENNCAEEPSKLCEFKRISGRILKTVDSVHQNVQSIDDCRDLCLTAPFRCHSYDYNETGEHVCRLSHHSRATLTDLSEPYLSIEEAATYEQSACYNVSIDCRSGEMITKIRTSKLFDGKVYAKGAPKSCAVNVNNSLEFDLKMRYNDLECNVRQSAYGRYMNDIVIQHHDMIVTSSDLGLAVSCQYDLTNKTVVNNVDLGVTGEIESTLSEEIIVDSPNVIMKITARDGSDMKRIAEVGDPLALRFEIVDANSPYEIFVRELVAMDGTDSAEITLIDANGCPTDQYIMSAMQKMASNRKVLLSQFDAFKFPSSELVQFRALVTPCIPRCEPVICDNDENGELKSLLSYGRRKRSVLNGTDGVELELAIKSERQKRDVSHQPAATDENILLVQSIQITDKFAFNGADSGGGSNGNGNGIGAGLATDGLAKLQLELGTKSDTCINGYGFIIAGALFLLLQLTVIAVWDNMQKRALHKR